MPPPTTINAAHIARVQTVLSLLAFGSALAIGCHLHYYKIVKNGVAWYPEEWFPSVSATLVGFFSLHTARHANRANLIHPAFRPCIALDPCFYSLQNRRLVPRAQHLSVAHRPHVCPAFYSPRPRLPPAPVDVASGVRSAADIVVRGVGVRDEQ